MNLATAEFLAKVNKNLVEKPYARQVKIKKHLTAQITGLSAVAYRARRPG